MAILGLCVFALTVLSVHSGYVYNGWSGYAYNPYGVQYVVKQAPSGWGWAPPATTTTTTQKPATSGWGWQQQQQPSTTTQAPKIVYVDTPTTTEKAPATTAVPAKPTGWGWQQPTVVKYHQPAYYVVRQASGWGWGK